MKKNIINKFIAIVFLFILLFISAFILLNAEKNTAKAEENTYFTMDSINLRIGGDKTFENSGLRFIVSFDEQTKNTILNNATEFGFLIAPTDLFNGVVSNYHNNLTKFVNVQYQKVNLNNSNDFDLIYKNADGYSANGVLLSIKEENISKKFSAVAYYKLNGEYTYASIPKNYSLSLQDAVSKYVLNNTDSNSITNIAYMSSIFNIRSDKGYCFNNGFTAMNILIYDVEDFAKMLSAPNFMYELANDIDFGSITTLENGSLSYYFKDFNKALDGANYTIKYSISDDGAHFSQGALFDTFSGSMKNIRIDGEVKGIAAYNMPSGSLAREFSGSIDSSIIIKSSARSGSYIQGIFGYLTSTASLTNSVIQETASEFKTAIAYEADENATINNVCYINKPFGFEIYLPNNTVVNNLNNLYLYENANNFISNSCYYYLDNASYHDPNNTTTNTSGMYNTTNYIAGNALSLTTNSILGFATKVVKGKIDFNK